jgi:hypothetical protein
MDMRFLVAFAALFVTLAAAQPVLRKPVFFDEGIMSEQRARDLIDVVRQNFWGKAKAFDGRTVIQPRDDAERRTIPIPEVDALWLIQAGSLHGEATRCGIDGSDFQKSFFKPFWGRYPAEKQIAFAATLMGAASGDVEKRRGKLECTPERKKKIEQVMQILKPSS